MICNNNRICNKKNRPKNNKITNWICNNMLNRIFRPIDRICNNAAKGEQYFDVHFQSKMNTLTYL